MDFVGFHIRISSGFQRISRISLFVVQIPPKCRKRAVCRKYPKPRPFTMSQTRCLPKVPKASALQPPHQKMSPKLVFDPLPPPLYSKLVVVACGWGREQQFQRAQGIIAFRGVQNKRPAANKKHMIPRPPLPPNSMLTRSGPNSRITKTGVFSATPFAIGVAQH